MSFRLVLFQAVALVLATRPLAAAPSPYGAFHARHHCRIAALLTRIHQRGPVDTSKDRFLTVSMRDAPQRYVQCIFIDADAKVFCEAASGAYRSNADAGVRLVLSERSVAALDALGFRQTERSRNFEREIDLGVPPDLARAAELMLRVLHEVYEAGPDTVLDIRAPRAGKAETQCDVPVG